MLTRLLGCATLLLLAGCNADTVPSDRARRIAERARADYAEAAIATLADLVSFETVHEDGVANAENPEFRAMTAYLKELADELGLDFADHGAVVVIGLGESSDRLGLIAHGDVQPADASKRGSDPFALDTTSEPGRLVGRGVEDDKGPIATALYAMKALEDAGLALARRIELIISLTEESDWEPFQAFLDSVEPPALNVALDAEYPVVVAEKGWSMIQLGIPPGPEDRAATPRVAALSGGAFLSQIPADAQAIVAFATDDVESLLRAAAERDTAVQFSFVREDGSLTIWARGRAAHSSKPWDGRNAITHLAALLGSYDWPSTQAGRMVRLINDLVGTGDYAERFGDVAYSHPFMGRLTLSLTTLGFEDGDLVAGINMRRPAGRSGADVERAVREALAEWERRTGDDAVEITTYIGEPYYLEDAPHVRVLLDIFGYYAGQEDPQPISIGGGTHARLLPNGLNFGPAMPGAEYTGHSEHEFMTREQYLLNLEMYTAMLVELAGRERG